MPGKENFEQDTKRTFNKVTLLALFTILSACGGFSPKGENVEAADKGKIETMKERPESLEEYANRIRALCARISEKKHPTIRNDAMIAIDRSFEKKSKEGLSQTGLFCRDIVGLERGIPLPNTM